MTELQNKTAIVTGAASGLGKATANAVAQAGANLCIADIDPTGLAETAAMVRGHGRQCVEIVGDLSDPNRCAELVGKTVDTFDRLDALCNVAGLIQFVNSHEMSDADWHRTMGVNLNAAFFVSRAAIPHLLKQDGAIVNVASTAAFIGEAYAAAYCASKAGMVAMTKAMAMEYMHQPIRINAIAPGGMATNIGANLRTPEGANIELIKRFSGMRGLVEVDDVANMIVHLASDAGRAFHGSCVTMDRGITAG